MDANSLEILAKVDAFYRGAFDSLLQLTVALIGLSVVLVPLIISFVQSRALRKENSTLKAELSQYVGEEVTKKVDLFEAKMISFFDSQLVEHRSAISEARADLRKKHDIARGGIFYIQAAAYADKGFFASAAAGFLDAVDCMIEGGDYVNLRKSLNQLVKTMPHLNKDSFHISDDLETSFESVIGKLAAFPESNHYADCLREIKVGLNAAKAREKSADT